MCEGTVTELICGEAEILNIMALCDDAFEKSIIHRDDFKELSFKICSYSKFTAAKINGVTAGYAAVYANNIQTRIAYLTLIGVRPEFQKRHIGARLLSECERIARENGMISMKLEVRDANTGAIKFYKKNGYRSAERCSDISTYMVKSLLEEAE